MQANMVSEWRSPVNTAAHQKGGIHDDATATDLGFKGGTVAGAIHMEQFPPLLLKTFGTEWWQSGTLSLYFLNATIDREPVRCLISSPERIGNIDRASVWMEKEDGTVVASGSASCGGFDEQSELRQRLAAIRPVSELRILKHLEVGALGSEQKTTVSNSQLEAQLRVITEPLSCYKTEEEFGARVLPMTQILRAFDPAELALIDTVEPPYVGLYGAIELQFLNGPVFSDTAYTGLGQIVGLSDSPQTEILWRDLTLSTDKPIARMLKMDRLMKNSSPLWR
ncbi:MAG: hypothetical protein ACNYPE_16135 [Candidatus Azotimanducaceae bacterium WSBS_2022_MAG_OTU7]